jgi:hypothetical protein
MPGLQVPEMDPPVRGPEHQVLPVHLRRIRADKTKSLMHVCPARPGRVLAYGPVSGLMCARPRPHQEEGADRGAARVEAADGLRRGGVPDVEEALHRAGQQQRPVQMYRRPRRSFAWKSSRAPKKSQK